MAVGIKVSNLTQQDVIDGDVNIHVIKTIDGIPTSFKTNVDNFIYPNSITSDKIAANAITAREVTASVLQINGDRIDNLSTSLGNVSTSLGNAITNITSLTETLNGLEDGGINTFYQTTAPTGVIGDLWFNTSTNKLTRWNGSAWITIEDAGITTAIADAAAAANVADNKITTYYNDEPPTTDLIDNDPLDALDTGDLWFDTNDSNKLYRWSGSAWVVVQDTSIQTNIYTTNTTTIDGGKITAASISANQIAANSITADKIAANAITATQIAACSITATQIAACSITATKIAACSIGATQIQSGAITAQALASNIVITGSIQSRNFDGFNRVDQTGEEILQYLDAGTQGFFLDERTGTAVFTDIIARDNIISANYIKYNANSGLSAIDADGNFGINLDNETLQIQDGRVMIKQIPSNSVIDESLYLNNNTVFFGQETTEVFALPPMKTWLDPSENINDDQIYNANLYYGGDVRDNIKIETPPEAIGVYTSSNLKHLLLHIDLFDYVDSPDQINGTISLNNVKFSVDFTDYASINYIDTFTFATKAIVTSTLGDTDSYTTTDNYFRNTVANPTMLPRVYEFVADINCGTIRVNNNSRYLSIYTYNYINVPNNTTDPDNPVTQYIGLSAEFNTDTNFRFDVYGAVPEDRIHSLSEITRLAPGRQIGLKFDGYSENWTIVNAEWSSADYIMDPTFYGPYTPLSWTPYV